MVEKYSLESLSSLNTEFCEYRDTHNLHEFIDFHDLADTQFIRDYKYPIDPRPFFVSKSFVDEMKYMNQSILALMFKAIKGLFGNDAQKMASALDVDVVACSLFLSGIPYEKICFRSDCVLTDSELKIVELNLGSAIGGWQLQWIEEIFRNHDSYKAFFEQHSTDQRNIPVAFFRFLLESALATASQCGDKSDNLAIAIMVSPGIDLDDFGDYLNKYQSIAGQEAGCQGTFLYFSHFKELSIQPSGVFLQGKKVQTVTFGDLGDQTPPVSLLRQILSGNVASPDFPIFRVLADKRVMALLYAALNSGLFTSQEQATIEKHIPKTFIMHPDFVSQQQSADVYANKDNYVFKKADGKQGDEVFIGRYISEEEWKRALDSKAGSNLWIAQEYCDSIQLFEPDDEHPSKLVVGVFQFGKSYGGCWLRTMACVEGYDGIINSARGAKCRLVYESHT